MEGGTKAGDAVGLRTGTTINARDAMSDFDDAITFRELYRGMKKSASGVRWKDSVAGYEANGLKNTYRLRQSLTTGKYRMDSYQRFKVYEPKEREIVATRFKDRQFQRALCDNVLYPQMTRSFIYDNCACQTGKGVDFAMDRLNAHLQRYYRKNGPEGWALQCDVRHYFEQTPHDVAMNILRRQIKDNRAAAYACAIVESFSEETWRKLLERAGIDKGPADRAARAITMARVERILARSEKDIERERRAGKAYVSALARIDGIDNAKRRELAETIQSTRVRGIGLGSQASQLLELSVLSEMDHYIKERLGIRHYIRYMDDFVLVHKDKAYLQHCLLEIRSMVGALGLELNGKTQLYPLRQGVQFLHWRFLLTGTGKVVRKMDSRKPGEERQKLRKLKGLETSGVIAMAEIQEHYRSWKAGKKKGNTRGALLKMDAYYQELYKEVPPK